MIPRRRLTAVHFQSVERRVQRNLEGSRKVGLGTTVEYTERKFKTKAKDIGAPCREKPLEKSGLEPAAPNRPADFLRMSIINILRGLPCRLESLRLKFINEPSIFVVGDLDESIKRSASDRLGDLEPQVGARTSPGVSRDMALLGLCLELSFSGLARVGERSLYYYYFYYYCQYFMDSSNRENFP